MLCLLLYRFDKPANRKPSRLFGSSRTASSLDFR